MCGGELANDKSNESEYAEEGENANLRAGEPVVPLAGVEDDLQRAETEGEESDTPEVNAAGAVLADVGRVMDKRAHHDHRDHADWQVEVEDPAPGVVVGDPSAERRAEDGRQDDTESEGSHRGAVLLGWKGFEEDGLGEGLEASAGKTLQDAKEDERLETGRHAAQNRRDGEAGDTGEKHVAAAETVGQPSGHREDDCVGHQVGGHNPGAFFDGRAHVAGEVRHRNVHDRGVEDLHERRTHDGGGHDPRIHGAPGLSRGHDAIQRVIIETPACRVSDGGHKRSYQLSVLSF